MKKNLLKLLALTFVLSLALTFTGCGSKDNDASFPSSGTTNAAPEASDSSSDETEESKTEDKSDAVEPSDNTGDSDADNGDDSDTADASEENNETGSSGEATVLEELVADPSMQQMAEQMSNDQYTAELLAENGNILIYRFTLVEQIDLSDESVSEVFVGALNSGLDSLTSTYDSILDSLRNELGMDDLIIRIEYLNADGNEILTRDFE